MASPTPPILSALAVEALKRSGYSNPKEDLLERAKTRWIEEIKAEIWAREKKLKSLQTKAVKMLTSGVGQYTNPTDYASDMTMKYVTGARYGTLQAGSSSSVTLAAADSGTQTETIGREIIITTGTGAGGTAFISSFNTGTKAAGVSPSFTTVPTAGSGYMIIETVVPLSEKPLWDYENQNVTLSRGVPQFFFPYGDGVDGGFRLLPAPYREDSQPMAVIQSYYSDITELDVSSVLMARLYQKWQPLFIAGIRWKCFQNDDDTRAAGAFQEYQKALRDVVAAEGYGVNVNSLQFMVCDY